MPERKDERTPPVSKTSLLARCQPTEDITRKRLEDRRFRGDGQPNPDPLPGAWVSTEPYIAPEKLRKAVNMALYLRRPLLLEGEPGTGKTRLAYAVACELGYPLVEIYIRSSSRAQDLLYTYDAVRRLYDIQERAAKVQWRSSVLDPSSGNDQEDAALSIERYIKLGELGEAIELSSRNVPTVILIDEIDKADIDFPNDLLLVLDRLRFDVDEVPGLTYDAFCDGTREDRRHFLPLIIITSNREKELPAPFLRRCLFYFIPFPNKEELRPILDKHLTEEVTDLFGVALTRFWELRTTQAVQWRKPPSTSELIDWVRILQRAILDHELDLDAIRTRPLSDLPGMETLVKMQSDGLALANAEGVAQQVSNEQPAAAAA